MAANLERILSHRIAGGWVNVKYGHGRNLKRIHIHEAGHPLPDAQGLEGSRKIVRMLEGLTRKIWLFSSFPEEAPRCCPAGSRVTLEEKQRVTQLLLRCGATIQEINTLRKHLSQVKAEDWPAGLPATLISLILSDVIGDPLEVIASGPRFPILPLLPTAPAFWKNSISGRTSRRRASIFAEA